MSLDACISGAMALLGMFGGWFIGSMDGCVRILLMMAIIDQTTGVLKGYVRKEWSSDAGWHGIAKKVVMFLLVGICNLIDIELLGQTELLRDAVCFFYIANEGLSIFENAIDIGAPVPDSLKERFQSWRNEHQKHKDDDSQ